MIGLNRLALNSFDAHRVKPLRIRRATVESHRVTQRETHYDDTPDDSIWDR